MISDLPIASPPVKGVISLHSSAVIVDGGVLLFLGPSRTGKSAMCSVLQGHTQLLADDKVFLVPSIIGDWTVADASESGIDFTFYEEGTVDRKHFPLRSIFRLYQAENARLVHISPMRTCRYLTDAFFELHWQRRFSSATKRYAFTNLANVARRVSGYECFFTKSLDTVHLFQDEFAF